MTLALSPDTEALIQAQINSGRFANTNEVLVAALDGLDRAEEMLAVLLADSGALNPALREGLNGAKTHAERLSIARSAFAGSWRCEI
jgi:Arc/MetJ-type ribon-helix-helix transcriptional regulator